MFIRAAQIFILAAVIAFGFAGVLAQGAESRTPGSPGTEDKDDPPKSLKEMLEKMRIAKAKKEHDDLIERGEEVLKIAEQIDESYSANARFTEDDLARLASIEQKVKKIRKEIGAKDDDDSLSEGRDEMPSAISDAFKTLRSTTAKLVDELKKTTRFSISAIAIESSNTVMKLARFLRVRR